MQTFSQVRESEMTLANDLFANATGSNAHTLRVRVRGIVKSCCFLLLVTILEDDKDLPKHISKINQ